MNWKFWKKNKLNNRIPDGSNCFMQIIAIREPDEKDSEQFKNIGAQVVWFLQKENSNETDAIFFHDKINDEWKWQKFVKE